MVVLIGEGEKDVWGMLLFFFSKVLIDCFGCEFEFEMWDEKYLYFILLIEWEWYVLNSFWLVVV